MLCCFPGPRGRSNRTLCRESTWARVRGWMAKSPCFRPLTRNCLAFRGSTGRVSPDPETWGPEMSGSPGQISLDLDTRHLGPPSPGQVQSGPATTIGAQQEESRAEDCMVRTALAGMQHPLREPPEWDFLDSCPIHEDSLLDPSGACIPTLQEGMVRRRALWLAPRGTWPLWPQVFGRSSFSVLHFLVELHSQETPLAELWPSWSKLSPLRHSPQGQLQPQLKSHVRSPSQLHLQLPAQCWDHSQSLWQPLHLLPCWGTW